MAHQKFDPAKLEKLNDPGRFEQLRPDAMWSALGSPQPSSIVEIGAGTGLFSAKFAELAPSAHVWACDTVCAMLEWMRDNRPEVSSGRITPVLSTETRVPLPDGIADLVVMINVHHELADPAAVYAEAARMTRPGGSALVVDWKPVETPKGPSLSVRASAEQIVAHLERSGFTAASVHDVLPWHSLVVARR